MILLSIESIDFLISRKHDLGAVILVIRIMELKSGSHEKRQLEENNQFIY